jgi:hypothetical protein
MLIKAFGSEKKRLNVVHDQLIDKKVGLSWDA